MKKSKSLAMFIIAGLFTITTYSCKKYDGGGSISSAEKNIKKSWTIAKYLRNSTDETSQLLIKSYQETYAENASYSRSYIDKKGDFKSDNGTYKFDKDKKKLDISGVSSIEITDKVGTVSSSYHTILKLNESELWYSYNNGSDTHEFHLVKK